MGTSSSRGRIQGGGSSTRLIRQPRRGLKLEVPVHQPMLSIDEYILQAFRQKTVTDPQYYYSDSGNDRRLSDALLQIPDRVRNVLNVWYVSASELKPIKELGRGTFGRVLASSRKGVGIAVKEIRTENRSAVVHS